jgi:hypothetical protein
MRAMKELCQRVTHQKMLIMQSLENDCDKGELNNQIAVSRRIFAVDWRGMCRFLDSLSKHFYARREANNMMACNQLLNCSGNHTYHLLSIQ